MRATEERKDHFYNGNITTNKAMIAEAFNSFFVNIGPKLADKIDIKN